MITIITIPRYEIGKSMITTACYKDGNLMITSLIIIKISFVCFQKDEVGGSRVRSHAKSYDHRSYDHSITIAFFFGISFDKQLIVYKAPLQLGKKPANLI